MGSEVRAIGMGRHLQLNCLRCRAVRTRALHYARERLLEVSKQRLPNVSAHLGDQRNPLLRVNASGTVLAPRSNRSRSE